jgi:hypothetical protein
VSAGAARVSGDDYWFPAKRYGWGWGPPRRWQGWAVLAVWGVGLAGAAVGFIPGRPMTFGACLAALSVALLAVCFLTGEPPAWRWGDND